MSAPNPKIHINGPKEEGGSDTGSQVDLYLVEDSDVSAKTEANQQSIPGLEDQDSVLAGLTGERSVRYTGVGNGLRLFYDGLGSDPVEALQRWLIDLESLVQSNQGVGYTIEDEMRNQTIGPSSSSPGVLFDSVRWEHQSGQTNFVEWSLSGQVSDGVQQASNRSDYVSNEWNSRDASITTDSVETSSISIPLGYVEDRVYEREVDLNTLGLVHQFDVPNVGISESGVKGTFSMSGKITSRDVSDLAQTARQINNDLHGVDATIRDAFTKRTWDGLITDSDCSFQSGIPNYIEYRIEMTIGTTVEDI